MNSCVHSHNSFVVLSQPLLCRPAEARVAQWHEQWEASDSNLNKSGICPINGSRMATHCRDKQCMANRVRSGQAATPAAKHLWGYRCHSLSLPMNQVCSGQSSDSECASAEWQSPAITPQFNLSFSFVSRISKHLIECIAKES